MNPQADFQRILNEELELLAQLNQSLSDEKQALEKRDLDGFNAIQEKKKNMLVALETKARQHFELAITITGNEDAEAAVKQVVKSAELDEQWQQLIDQLQQCQRANQVNGRIIAMAQRSSEQTLNKLKGINNDDSLYDPSGKAAHSGGRIKGIKA